MTEREILEAVARGELSPEDAARQLDDTARPGAGSARSAAEPRGSEASDRPVRTVKIAGAFQAAKIVGDASVATAVVDEGAHTVRLEGSTLIIDANPPEDGGGFRFSEERTRKGRTRFHIGIDSRPAPLKIRMNPTLALETEVAAGTLTVDGVHGPIKAEVAAGACKLADIRSPFDIMVATGAVKVIGKLTSGDSKIRCETGGVKVLLDPASSVRIKGRAGLGKVSLPGAQGPSGLAIGSSTTEATVGDGAGTLTIDCSLGAVKVGLQENEDA
ncbi:MAG: hypothetical protein ACLGH3_06310 [Actinomycetota bacterium]